MSTFESITVPQETVLAHYADKGLDAVALAHGYIEAWAAKVSSGTQMILAKMKCALADGPCGCPANSTVAKCTGPYPPVPIEIIMGELAKGVAGVEAVMLPAPKAVVEDGHVHFVEFASPHSLLADGPAKAMYVKKL